MTSTAPVIKSPSASAIEMNELLLPQHTNSLRSAFGGTIMSWIDICAALAAQRHARRVVVTASMDQLDFLSPIREGELVNLKGMVNFTGRTSMEVGVRVEAENTISGERRHAASAYLTFVAISPDGRPHPIPAVVPETDEEKLRFEDAKVRRAKRLDVARQREALRET